MGQELLAGWDNMTKQREIKFRAWLPAHHGVIAGAYYTSDPDKKPLEFDYPGRMSYSFNPVSHGEFDAFRLSEAISLFDENYILMQYTGLKDKNGKEIYEGDVITHRWGTGVVEWSDSPGAWSWSEGTDWGEIPSGVEVIGNIYENPDMLKIG